MKLPTWVLFCFLTFGICGGYIGGRLDTDAGSWDMVGAAVLGIGAVVAPLVVAKMGKRRKMGEAAVSPVIGVILMVAITVVLAAVVFYLVSTLSKNVDGTTPHLTFSSDDGGETFLLLHAPKSMDWSDFTVTGCTTVPTGNMTAGDRLEGCTPPVTVVHEDTNSVAWTSGESA